MGWPIREGALPELDFPEGVRWRCKKCGMCCGDTSDRKRRILAMEYEVDSISRFTGLEADAFSYPTGRGLYTHAIRKVNGVCVFLKEGSCSIYDVRPLVCVFYPFSMSLRNGRLRFELTKERCPGIGEGEVLGREYFEELLRAYGRVMEAGAQALMERFKGDPR
ncbi:MAG: YkgJ family cysteine cluster protein [Candidatus Bathyarchaeia archaeon]